MADITVQCLSCGNEINVSDVVDLSKLRCRSCGGEFLRAGQVPAVSIQKEPGASSKKSLLKPRPREAAAEAQSSDQQPPAENKAQRLAWDKLNNPEGQKQVQRESGRLYSALTWKAWVLFFAVGAVAGFLRYSGVIPAELLQQAALYEALTLLVLHIFIVLKAFQDSVFQGVLCILIPPYSVYYLFSASDDFYLRALVAGLLVGIGQDSGILVHEWSITMIDSVNEWIASGG